METILESEKDFAAVNRSRADADFANPGYQAFTILRLGFTVAPIIAGADKFLHLLVNWNQYLPPIVKNTFGESASTLMLAVGVIEIIAGIGVLIKPKIFAYVVAAWFVVIIVNLL